MLIQSLNELQLVGHKSIRRYGEVQWTAGSALAVRGAWKLMVLKPGGLMLPNESFGIFRIAETEPELASTCICVKHRQTG